MERPKFQIFFLLTILLTSSIIRFYQLGKIPNGLSADEADVGYNAFSVLMTGKDVYNRPYPLFFQSFDIYQPPFQAYISIPAIYFFGLSDFSMRIAPAILGTITPVLFFFLSKLLFPKQVITAYIAAIIATLAPWNIAASRAQMVTIEVIFLYLSALILFLTSISKNIKLLPLSFILLGSTIYAYHIALIYLPIIFVILAFVYRRQLLNHKVALFISLGALVTIILPALIFYQDPDTRNRLNTISIFIPDVTLPTSIAEIEFDQKNNIPFSNLVHNRRLVYASSMLDNYFDYFNLDNLFASSRNIRYFYINNVGLFYLIELPFVFYGLYIMTKRRSPSDFLILALLLIAPIPASISLGSSFYHRAPIIFIALQLISALGITAFLTKVSSKKIITALFFIYIGSVYFFLHQYFIHNPQEFTSERDNGAWYSTMKSVIPLVNERYEKYDRIIFTWSSQRLMPHVYFLFYNQIHPQLLQERASKFANRPSYTQIYNPIGKIEFRKINWEEDKKLKKTLLVGYEEDFPKDVAKIGQTTLPNGKPHFLMVETDQ